MSIPLHTFPGGLVGPNRDAPPAPPLRLVFWETTTGCNLACVHCRRLEVSRELSKFDMSTEHGPQPRVAVQDDHGLRLHVAGRIGALHP